MFSCQKMPEVKIGNGVWIPLLYRLSYRPRSAGRDLNPQPTD